MSDDRGHATRVAEQLAMADDEPERLPWCPDCECYAVPEDGDCGECGAEVTHTEGRQ